MGAVTPTLINPIHTHTHSTPQKQNKQVDGQLHGAHVPGPQRGPARGVQLGRHHHVPPARYETAFVTRHTELNEVILTDRNKQNTNYKQNTGQSPEGREAITRAFDEYVHALEPLYEEFGAFPHWAKVGAGMDRLCVRIFMYQSPSVLLPSSFHTQPRARTSKRLHTLSMYSTRPQIEVPEAPARLQWMKERLWARYPAEAFNLVRCVPVSIIACPSFFQCDDGGRLASEGSHLFVLQSIHVARYTTPQQGLRPQGRAEQPDHQRLLRRAAREPAAESQGQGQSQSQRGVIVDRT